ncbi:hypothetical protein ERX46_03195 [Brumimicrobium glaciale]|uniref:Phosphoribosylformylglycinamidine synthase n=1 Tax=Brumimicrobium glaciale TaxID=200475 RepID=A0A4Q4KRH5_9FLAO|nr:AIR synthase related protein [Brumimicrobium glaciale]RYM36017.1 hypothetical protein ERX46_03195 [Brumimicrobium glaciale]
MESTIQQEATLEEAKELGLTKDDFELIKKTLGRTPNITETNIYGTMWSGSFSLIHIEKWIKTLPNIDKDGGIIDLGEDIGCVLNASTLNQSQSSETNHKSGLNFDTIAQINSFRFGTIENNASKKSLTEAIKAISDSANTSKITSLEGDVFFDNSFNSTSIVNTFSVGIINSKKKGDTSGTENHLQTLDFCSEKVIKDICAKFDLKADQFSVETDLKSIRYYNNKVLIANLPIDSLIKVNEDIVGDEKITAPAYFQESKAFNINDVKEPEDLKEVADFLLKQPNIASKRWINNHFNTLKRTGANIGKPLSDAGMVHIEDTNRGLAITVGGNPRYIKADPQIGTSIAVAEAARNIVCSGGEPKAISTCFNFGNPNNPETSWHFTNSIRGMSAACEKFKTPVINKKVSFQDQSIIDGEEVSISPIPTIGMVGLLEDKKKAMSLDFKTKGDLIFIIGEAVECIASSEYLYAYHGVKASPAPHFNMDKEYKLQEVIKSLIKKDLVNAAHDCSVGGIFITLSEMAIPNELGFDIVTDAEIREDAFLFGESTGRVLVGVNEVSEEEFIEFMMNSGINFTLLGHVTQGKLVVDDDHFGFIQEAKKSYNSALEKLIES